MSGVSFPVLMLALAILAGLVAIAVAVLRRLDLTGTPLGGEIVVRCREGHLFTTVWIPLVSVKAIRLGPVRFQYCPVGEHWTFVIPVPDRSLTPEQRRFAHRHRDGGPP